LPVLKSLLLAHTFIKVKRLRGTVIKSTGSWYIVEDHEGKKRSCRLKGKFRTKNIQSTNPVAVGDEVIFTTEEEHQGIIDEIEERKNYIIRRSVNLSKRNHIVAANIDQAILLITIKQPLTSTGFIDRFLVTAEAYHIPVLLVFNKRDLYDDDDLTIMESLTNLYEKIGYACYNTNATSSDELLPFQSIMKNKRTLISGHSGTGKSTFVNGLDDTIQLTTGEISSYHQTGVHTTTFAEMHELHFGGYIIDTPGIKGLGVIDIPKQMLSHYFPEMRLLLPNCKFHNCVHQNEPHCAIKNALDSGTIQASRYENYQRIYNDDDENYRSVDY
jgi:ribosome biogenesis GTPase